MQTSDHQIIFSLIMSFIIAGLTGYYAEQKGRSSIAWFIITLFISFIAPLILYFLPPLNDIKEGIIQPIDKPITLLQSPPQIPKDSDAVADKLWYYLDANHQQYGPVSLIALKELWDTARLDLNSYVWSEGMEKWERVESLPKLREALHHPSGLI